MQTGCKSDTSLLLGKLCVTDFIFLLRAPGFLQLACGFLRGNGPSDKLITDNSGGVWLPVVEQGTGFSHLKLLSQYGEGLCVGG